MSEKNPAMLKGFDFVFRALVYALLFMAILHAFKPYIEGSKAPVNSAEAEALARHAEIISPEALAAKIKTSKKPTVLVVYASWCGYCRQVLPMVIAEQNNKAQAGKQFVFVSVDRKLSNLAGYILENRYEKSIHPLYVINADPAEQLKALGASFNGSIPYLGVFNAKGKLQAEHKGALTSSELAAALKTR